MKILNRLVLPALLLALGAIPALRPAYTAPPPPERSHIDSAVDALYEAKRELGAAGHDFCGHKGEAIEAVDRALTQLREAAECQRGK